MRFCHSISQTESQTCDQTNFGQWWRACSSGPTAWRFLLATVHASMYEAMHNLSIHKVSTMVHVCLKINCNIYSIFINFISFKKFEIYFNYYLMFLWGVMCFVPKSTVSS